MKFLSTFLLLICAITKPTMSTTTPTPTEGSKVSMEVLQSESRGCNEHILKGKASCVASPNCCYYEAYIEEYEEHNNFCVGLNNFIQLHAVNVPEYLKSINE